MLEFANVYGSQRSGIVSERVFPIKLRLHSVRSLNQIFRKQKLLNDLIRTLFEMRWFFAE